MGIHISIPRKPTDSSPGFGICEVARLSFCLPFCVVKCFSSHVGRERGREDGFGQNLTDLPLIH